MNQTNIVIGATGIVGSHVVLQLLLENQKVIACKQISSNIQQVKKLFAAYTENAEALFAKIEWRDIDLKDVFSIEDAIEGADVVYHCAGFVSFNSFERKQLMDVNVEGTKNIVNACLQKQIRALCYVSSLATMHNLDVKESIDETVFWKTSGKESDYAFSKYKAELEVWRGIEEGLNTVIVNPGVILSPVFWNQSSARIFATCFKGNKFYPPGQTAYVSAKDVAVCMLLLVKNKNFGQRYILTEGNYTYKEIFSHIQQKFNKAPPFIRVNRAFLRLGWIADSLAAFVSDRPANITKAIIQSAFNKQVYSNRKVTEALQYQFEPALKSIDFICSCYERERP